MTSSIPSPRFKKGDQVQLRSDRSKVGVVIRSPTPPGPMAQNRETGQMATERRAH